MKRFKRYKVKKERSANSSDLVRDKEEHDLAYYIHDRVELMHQVFSCLKYRELKSMAPECVRHISLDDLQELCTEELLGISSKRLCAIMDGAEPPSDTESSSPSPSPENLETISLDSISSDEEILSQASSKKHKKHKHHHGTKAKSKRKKSVDKNVSADKSQATRAGLTVLELLELQARARAIRAQLQQEQLKKQPTETVVAPPSRDSSDGEVEIKEEQAEVVEISSDEEKPKIEDLQAEVQSSKEMQPGNQHETTTVTKRVNDLIITVPQTTSPRKIKLNRNKSVSASITDKSTSVATTCHIPASSAKNDIEETKIDKPKKKKKDKKQKVDKAGSDNDEITLQLSDSEKMDLLEDLHRKSVSSMDSKSSSDDSDSSESATMSDEVKITVDEKLSLESEQKLNDSNALDKNKKNMSTESISEKNIEQETVDTVEKCDKDITVNNEIDKTNSGTALVTLNTQLPPEGDKNINDVVINNTYTDVCDSTIEITIESTEKQASIESLNPKESEAENVLEVTKIDDILIEVSNTKQPESESACVRNNENSTESSIEPKQNEKDSVNKDNTDLETEYNDKKEPKDMNGTEMEVVSLKENESTLKTNMETKQLENDLSEGEISGNESSEVKAVSINHEVVCISDDERKRSQKKKKKKDKKSKKEKKNKKKDFHESSDQNFYKNASKINEKESSEKSEVIEVNDKIVIVDLNVLDDNFNIDNTETSKKESVNSKNENSDKNPDIITIDNEHYRSENVDTINVDDIYQILELSDDSSCYEIDGAVLSIEPTTQEMETLSAKIDEFERVEVITDKEIREYEEASKLKDISWKDRYLDSTKVKKVLTTSQIFNALRKKNKELKSKILESKKNVEIEQHLETDKDKVVEGTIDHYNTLQASTKYVDPVKEMTEEDINTLTGAMKKDAKQLLKMYKRLLKYNDMNKQKDSKKRKKKKKTEKNDESVVNKEVYDLSQLCIRVCWECRALLRRLDAFKHQVKRSYTQLMNCFHQGNVAKKFISCTPHLQVQQIHNISLPPNEIKTELEHVKTEIDIEHCEPETFVNNITLVSDMVDNNVTLKTSQQRNVKPEKPEQQKSKKKLKKHKLPKIRKTKVKNKRRTSAQSLHDLGGDDYKSDLDNNVEDYEKNEINKPEEEDSEAKTALEVTKPDEQGSQETMGLDETMKPELNIKLNGEVKRTRQPPSKEILPEKPECAECGKKFSSRKTYRYHLNVLHKGQNRYPCPRCGKVYQWKSNLGRHIRTHKARDSGELYCETCDKRFASVATYRQHLRVSRRHVPESEFSFMCNDCGKKFVNKTRLRDHIDWDHLKKIKFRCQLCNKPFKCHTSLYVHMQNVHRNKEKKDNLCHVCGKSYQNAAKLKYHIVAMHTSETPYQCEQCNAAFGWYSSLYRHVREVHYKMKVQPKKSKKAKKNEVLPSLLPPQIILSAMHQPGPP